ncbi:MAG: LysM domain-containing protein [Acidimicrobiales bacterium]
MALWLSALALAFAAAGCGRSAPEGAASTDGGSEPVMAGIEVVSDEPVIVPPPTTATVPTTATTAPPATAGSYVVESGDTLSVIARRFNVSVDALSQANGITDVNTIRPGQELVIPG